MPSLLDSTWLFAAGCLAVAAVAGVAAYREDESKVARFLWTLTALLFVGLAVGSATDLGRDITSLGRHEAFSGGWYGRRRKIQALAVVALGAGWVAGVVAAYRHYPRGRRRFLPPAVIGSAAVAYVGVRLVSLHQVDGLLYRREIAGVEVGTWLELVGVGLAFLVTAALAARPHHHSAT